MRESLYDEIKYSGDCSAGNKVGTRNTPKNAGGSYVKQKVSTVIYLF